MTVAERLTWMAARDYDPALDLVAVAPDGSPAAYCFCALHREENRLSGRNDRVIDPVATPCAPRSRAGAGAVVHRNGAARGAARALLGTSSDNRPMQATAQAIGYRIESERVWSSWRARTSAKAL